MATTTTLLNAIIDVVDAPLFIVGEKGALIVANDAGRRLLESKPHSAQVHKILRMCATTDKPEITTWSIDEVSAWRRFIEVDNTAYALVVIEVARASIEAVLKRAVQTYSLTNRQSEVLRLTLEGASNKEIASRLHMAPRTVEVHLTAIFEKTGVESRARLIAKAWDSRPSVGLCEARTDG
jgi:DNA-binding CsgD family transcriptional regulator